MNNYQRYGSRDKIIVQAPRYIFIPKAQKPKTLNKKYIIGGSIAAASLIVLLVCAYKHSRKRTRQTPPPAATRSLRIDNNYV